jgi:hypothetical protein
MVVVDEVDACLLQQDTRAQLHTLLAKYLSPSYLTAELEEQMEREREEGPGGSGRAFKPWRLARRQTVFCSATIPQHHHFVRQCVQQQWTIGTPMHVQVGGWAAAADSAQTHVRARTLTCIHDHAHTMHRLVVRPTEAAPNSLAPSSARRAASQHPSPPLVPTSRPAPIGHPRGADPPLPPPHVPDLPKQGHKAPSPALAPQARGERSRHA